MCRYVSLPWPHSPAEHDDEELVPGRQVLAVVGHLLLRGAVPLHQSAVSIAARRPITAQYHLHALRVVHVVVVLAVLLVLVVVLGLVVPPALELQTKVHTKVRYHGEGPYKVPTRFRDCEIFANLCLTFVWSSSLLPSCVCLSWRCRPPPSAPPSWW